MGCIVTIKSMEDLKKDPHIFCPLTRKECNDKCMWCVRQDHISSDGMDTYYDCIVNLMYYEFLQINGAHQEEDEY